jgi:hypothetical protein
MLTFAVDSVNDNSYKSGVDFVSDDIDIFVEEIKMILDTSEDDVLGASGMDADIERYVFKNSETVNVDMIASKVFNVISTYSQYSDDFFFSIECKFADGVERDIIIMFIDIRWKKNKETRRNVSITIS